MRVKISTVPLGLQKIKSEKSSSKDQLLLYNTSSMEHRDRTPSVQYSRLSLRRITLGLFLLFFGSGIAAAGCETQNIPSREFSGIRDTNNSTEADLNALGWAGISVMGAGLVPLALSRPRRRQSS